MSAGGTVREVVRWPASVLSRVCAPVTRFDAGLGALTDDMFATMYAAPGRGLAAPQVGEGLRIFVMDPGWKDGAPEPRAIINPRIVWAAEDVVTRPEGCLSIPGVLVEVTRPETVRLEWQDVTGAGQEAVFEGFAAAVVQHELDHLDGLVTFDRLTPEARAAAERAYAAGPEP